MEKSFERRNDMKNQKVKERKRPDRDVKAFSARMFVLHTQRMRRTRFVLLAKSRMNTRANESISWLSPRGVEAFSHHRGFQYHFSLIARNAGCMSWCVLFLLLYMSATELHEYHREIDYRASSITFSFSVRCRHISLCTLCAIDRGW